MDSSDQNIDFLSRIVQSERRPGRRRYTKTLHHRHSAMMARTDGHSFLVENRPYVMGMNMIKHEGNNASFFLRGANDSKSLDLSQGAGRIGEQVMFVSSNLLPIQTIQIIDSCPKPYAARDMRGSSFKLIRQNIVMSFFKSN